MNSLELPPLVVKWKCFACKTISSVPSSPHGKCRGTAWDKTFDRFRLSGPGYPEMIETISGEILAGKGGVN